MPTYVALDLETTGLDAERDAIIEIGAVRFRDDEVLAEFSALIHPGRPVPPEITALTGITDDELAGAPRIQQALPQIQEFVGRSPVVGHSVGFDLAFLRPWGALTSNPALDTFRLATILAPDAQRYNLGELSALFGLPPATFHRALDDARSTHRLFQALFGRALALRVSLLEELVRLGERINWPSTEFFRQALHASAHSPAASSIGAQLSARRAPRPGEPVFAIQETPPELIPRERAERIPLAIDDLAALLDAEGAFAQQFPGFEYRAQQIDMLRAVAQALNEGRQLMVEAPTGVGKSLAYLIPAVCWAVQNDERVVISTNTINLQEQLYHKDLPDLAQALPVELRAAVLKGRSHYLCLARLAGMQRSGPASVDEMDVLARALVWLPNTLDGDGDALFLPTTADRAIWRSLSADFDGCDPERCRFAQRNACFFYRARRAAESAHLLIVNHALLLADAAVQNRALPEYRYLIVDEAHHLEAATTGGLSFSIDQAGLRRLLGEVGVVRQSASPSATGLLGETLDRCRGARLDPEIMDVITDAALAIGRAVERAGQHLHAFFERLETFAADSHTGQSHSGYATRLRVVPALRVQPAWDAVEMVWDDAATPLLAAAQGLERLANGLDDLDELGVQDVEDLQAGLFGAARRIADVQAHLNHFVGEPGHETIYWLQIGPGQNPLEIHAAPLHVGPLVQEHIFYKKEAVILTSATLRTAESFDFLRERLHAWDADELAVDSPFDYANATLVYLVDDVPEPGRPGYQRGVAEGMTALFKATRGRALALFTSYSQLQATARAVSGPLGQADITVYSQGQGLSRNQLLENFRTMERSVLLGTRSFWEGVDVPGEALSCLAIAKLPFNVPTDPVFAARSETFDDPFTEYAVPEAVLRFLQGFGRLIRSRTDRGIVVIFDRRLLTKSYGQVFIDSLPGPTVQRGPTTMLPRIAAEWLDRDK